MIVTFCGHSDFLKTETDEQRILAFLKEKIGDQTAEMYLGGYGSFDHFAYNCCKIYQATHTNISLVFVTPYLSMEYQRNHLNDQTTRYDAILYPEIEDRPMKYAITYRNRYMVEKADYVVAFINRNWGGAYATYQYAKKKCKNIFNLADFE